MPDAAATAPAPEFPGDELPTLVRDEMPGPVAHHLEETPQEPAHGIRRGLPAEDRESHDAPRAMVEVLHAGILDADLLLAVGFS